jgi:asparagine synthase (glutamine-hydrolysing)
MSGMCGYLNASAPRDAVLGLDGSPLRRLSLGAAGISVAASRDSISLHQETGLLAAVWGRASLDGSRELVAPRLAALWRLHGPKACEKLSGHFAVCVIDGNEGQVLLAVDCSGVHTMHYQRTQTGLVFSSSVAALGGELDPQALYDYLYFHVIPAPRSVYRHQHRLLPGQYVLYQRGKLECATYWRMRFQETDRLPFAQKKQQFLSLLRDAVRQSADGAEKVGAFLSGGTDSSTLAGLLAQLGGDPAHTYSIGFDVKDYDEMAYARIASRHFQTRHHEYYLTAGDVVDAIPRIAMACDQPFGNSSIVPAYFCAQMARADGVSRLLGGDGGDELFGGNARYARQHVFARYERLPFWLRQAVLEPLLFGLLRRRQATLLRKARSYIEQALVPMPAQLETYNLLQRYGPSQMLDADFLASVDQRSPLAQLNACYSESDGLSLINRMQALDLRYTLADNDLCKVNLACALAGVEAAFPLLADDVLAFSARLSPRDKLNGTQLRYFFKHALKEHLPVSILRKQKHGFGMPFGHWLLADAGLRELAHDSLNTLKTRRIVRADFVDRLMQTLVQEHPAYHGTMVWVLMMLEQWLAKHHAVAVPAAAAEIAGDPVPKV